MDRELVHIRATFWHFLGIPGTNKHGDLSTTWRQRFKAWQMEYDPEIVVDELTKNLPGLLGGIMTKPYTIVIPIYEQVTSMSGDGIKVFSTVQPWFKCFFPKDRGSNITSFAGRHVLHIFTQWKNEFICPAILQHGWKITHLSMIYFFFPIVRFNYDW